MIGIIARNRRDYERHIAHSPQLKFIPILSLKGASRRCRNYVVTSRAAKSKEHYDIMRHLIARGSIKNTNEDRYEKLAARK